MNSGSSRPVGGLRANQHSQDIGITDEPHRFCTPPRPRARSFLPRTEVLSGKDERKRKGGDSTRKWGCPGFGSILELFIPTLRAVTWLELNVMAQPIIGKRRLATWTVCGKVFWSNWLADSKSLEHRMVA